MRLFIRIAILISTLSFLIMPCCSCVPKDRYTTIERQTEYHERVSDIEQYVLAEMGDYIAFDEPIMEAGSGTINWYVSFVTDYTMNEETRNNYPLLKAADDTRLLLNQYFAENPECYLLNYNLRISFLQAPDQSPGSSVRHETIGVFSNVLFNNETEGYLCSVDYFGYLDQDTISLIESTGILQIDLSSTISDAGEVLYIIDQLPEVETVLVKTNLVDELSNARDNISFIGR